MWLLGGRDAAAMAAAVWAVVFAVPSFYWGFGGDFGLQTIAADPEQALGAGAEPLALFAIGCLKLLAALFALSYLRTSLPVSKRLHITAGAFAAAALAIYGSASLADHALMLAGVRDIPDAAGSTAVRWHLAFWDPSGFWVRFCSASQ